MSTKDRSSLPPHAFPISGRDVCELLEIALHDGELCVIKDIETLCSKDCTGLGDVWRRVRASHEETLEKEELLAVLIHADQVISLNLYVKNDCRRILYIDDGELVENEIATPSQ
ncbi:hypothetical protein V4890_23320 [Ralstonia solanacearum species complex bacterium KE056]|uniref:hypothetical protein n=1 Tax=Ralstonia solanacearum species complex bacterium KE056 TaxID=3119585 RepID=UPI002FC3561B